MAHQKPFKLVVVGIGFKDTPKGSVILTQCRKVQNKEYDPLYDDTWEAMGETVELGEDIISALIRGFAEECGHPEFKPLAIYGTQMQMIQAEWWTTGKGDRLQYLEPLCFLHNMADPQPWTGPAFAVKLPEDFEPNFELADGEASGHRWWTPEELKKAIEKTPGQFFGLTMPALYKLCLKLPKTS